MSYFSQSTINSLNTTPSNITSLWSSNGAAFKTDLQKPNGTGTPISGSPFANISDKQAKLAFCALRAFEAKPYGSSSANTLAELTRYANTTGDLTNGGSTLSNIASMTDIELGQWVTGTGIQAGTLVTAIGTNSVTLNKTMTATATGVAIRFETPLSCGQYAKLTLEFLNILDATIADNSKKLPNGSVNPNYSASEPVCTVWGFNGNAAAVGNHAQLIIYDPAATEKYLLCDPTAGLFAVVSPDNLNYNTAALPSKNIVDFWTVFNGSRQTAAGIGSFLAQIKAAITNFKYRMVDVIYNEQGLSNFAALIPATWRTPQYWNL